MEYVREIERLERIAQAQPVTVTMRALWHHLAYLYYHVGNGLGAVHVSNAALATRLGISESAMVRARAALVELGLLRCCGRKGETPAYEMASEGDCGSACDSGHEPCCDDSVDGCREDSYGDIMTEVVEEVENVRENGQEKRQENQQEKRHNIYRENECKLCETSCDASCGGSKAETCDGSSEGSSQAREGTLLRNPVTSTVSNDLDNNLNNNKTPKSPSARRERLDKAAAAEKFARFWAAYPRRTARVPAEKAFYKLNPDDVLFARMMQALDRQKRSEQWRKDNGAYVPYPATWLNQARWDQGEDLAAEQAQSQTQAPANAQFGW